MLRTTTGHLGETRSPQSNVVPRGSSTAPDHRNIGMLVPGGSDRVVIGTMFTVFGARRWSGPETSHVPGVWPAVVVAAVGLFMLIAGIGPLWLPILVLLLGLGVAVAARRAKRT
jgi:hypothetical protein